MATHITMRLLIIQPLLIIINLNIKYDYEIRLLPQTYEKEALFNLIVGLIIYKYIFLFVFVKIHSKLYLFVNRPIYSYLY